ncbi:hypothetical protein CKK33_09970 [Mucilaginibacter sp. MD40]|uniref:hypothetical protein n=1 Tax=Mucilaginibacter sp. MD40 TaxID=2029590 RepID=UPI000BACA56A|nr:hypothetical protein [Mucilaginibacter sp. MD40]PAW93804.1 hypothetical protein CKK33_09970 [Mucilaginibacter sp. MD40]
MKSKEDILQKYYSYTPDGIPEINHSGLLEAMEEYRLEAEEAAFNAARQMQQQQYQYSSFKEYKESLSAQPAQVSESDKIKLIADSIVEQFLPSDPAISNFSFSFRTEGKPYTAIYARNQQGYWEYQSFTPDN